MTGITRPARQSDRQALFAIWRAAFGDAFDQIEAFFNHFYDASITLVAETGGHVAAAGYLLPAGALIAAEIDRRLAEGEADHD